MRELVWLFFSGCFAPHASFDGVHVESIWRSMCLCRFVWKRTCSLVSLSAFAKTISAVFSQWAANTLLHWSLWVATCARKIQCGDVNVQHFDSYVETVSVSLRLSMQCKRILDGRRSWECKGMRSVACDTSGSQTAPEPARCPNLETQPSLLKKKLPTGWQDATCSIAAAQTWHRFQTGNGAMQKRHQCSVAMSEHIRIHSEQIRPNLLNKGWQRWLKLTSL